MNFFATSDFLRSPFGDSDIVKSLILIVNNHTSVDGLANGDRGVLQATTGGILNLVELIII